MTMDVLVGRDGLVKEVKVVSSTPVGVFDAAAVEAVRKWRVKPAMRDGEAIEEWRRVPIQFKAGNG